MEKFVLLVLNQFLTVLVNQNKMDIKKRTPDEFPENDDYLLGNDSNNSGCLGVILVIITWFSLWI